MDTYECSTEHHFKWKKQVQKDGYNLEAIKLDLMEWEKNGGHQMLGD